MRASEIERLSTLRKKKESGVPLKEKELARLEQLEELEKEELLKNGGNSIETGGRSGNNDRSEQELGSGESAELGNGSKQDSGIDSLGGQTSSGTGQRKRRSKQNRDSSGEPRGESGGIETSSGEDNRADREGELGSNGSNRGSEGEAETQEILVSVKPRDIKPKRQSSKKTDAKKEVTTADVFAKVLQTGFATIAQVSGRKHWSIDEDEAQSVAEPLSKMLDGMSRENKKKLEKLTNPIMLASAVAGIVVPRLLTDMASMKRGGVVIGTNTGATNNKSENNHIGRENINGNFGQPGNVEKPSSTISSNLPIVEKSIAKLINGSDSGNPGGSINI